MQIRFISGLTAEEENQIAPALLRAVTTLLDQFSLAYTLRIETSDQIHQHSQPAQPQTTGGADRALTAGGSGDGLLKAPSRSRRPQRYSSRHDG